MSSSSPTSPVSQAAAPTTRSRTLLFVSYRDSTARSSRSRRKNPFLPQSAIPYTDSDGNGFHADDEQSHLISHSDDPTGHVALDIDVPPKWVDISDQVHDILAATQQKISILERLHAKHVLPGFADRSAEEREIEAVTTDITRDFRRCQSLVQSIPAATASQQRHAFPPRSQAQSRHEKLAAQNVQRALAAKVQELSAAFRKKQRVYLETLQGHAIKNQDLLVASGAVTLKGSEGMSDLDEDMRVAARNQTSSSQLQQQQIEADVDVDLQARDREITEIARSISALAELFKDLSTLVIDQGTLLDSVEYNIEQTSVNMAEAVTELRVAEGYQKNTGRRKCIFLLLLIIFGLVLVLIFKPRRHAASPPPPPSPPSTVTAAPAAAAGKEESTMGGDHLGLPPIPVDVTNVNPEALAANSQNPRIPRRRVRRGSSLDDDDDDDRSIYIGEDDANAYGWDVRMLLPVQRRRTQTQTGRNRNRIRHIAYDGG
ncbi:t-SNARE [Fomitiporia mediterranea MF3/22]|uniref:t-SNARE n=1 Tax=Fomitiporia mediterranea (strain MF3/22) TaxID=694068 RepID=UPI0004409B12|nr:t-SNARE [Fomitiporia mediterranea MF3/22]EJD02948.1 t-SNARE [Fomitiporia mediterranea MF3/22]